MLHPIVYGVLSKTETPGPLPFIQSSLANYNRVCGAHNDLDTVCLKMWSYLPSDVQGLTGLKDDVERHREVMPLRKLAQGASKAARRQELASAEGDQKAKDLLNQRLKEGRPVELSGDISHGDAVFRFVCVHQMSTTGKFDHGH